MLPASAPRATLQSDIPAANPTARDIFVIGPDKRVKLMPSTQ
jgi:hypothetical protein